MAALELGDVYHMYYGSLINPVFGYSDNATVGIVRMLFTSMVDFVLAQKAEDESQQ